MSHHVTDIGHGSALTSLVIRGEETGNTGEIRISRGSRGRGGLHVKVRHGAVGQIRGEDLYALRALLEEIPEEQFVEPAPSYEIPDRYWNAGDVIRETGPGGRVRVWSRDSDGEWRCPQVQGLFASDFAIDLALETSPAVAVLFRAAAQ